jgi:hypothetical protein
MADREKRVQASGYLRTLSAANVRDGKDSEQRQRLAIERHAEAAGFAIVGWFFDAAVSGADPVEAPPRLCRHARPDRGERRPYNHRGNCQTGLPATL